tara:strand:- start:1581 stop:1922 length:342 start_codon:yes stop_codon:yes gene_type:complete
MSMTYTWKVIEMKIKDQTNADGDALKDAVIGTLWSKTGKDTDGNEGTFQGATPFTAENTPKGSFTALAELKESDVLGWIQAQVTGDYETHVNGKIQEQIDNQAIKETDLPWVS